MATILTRSLFDESKPIQSIVRFTNGHRHLSQADKQEFVCDLETFFSDLAYKDTDVRLPKGYSERIASVDLETLKLVISEIDAQQGRVRFLQLVATISKVTAHHFNKEKCYQIRVGGSPGFWGWIKSEYVDASEKLKEKLNAEKGIIECDEIKPSVLMALQRLEWSLSSGSTLDLSPENLSELFFFASTWAITPLGKILKNISPPYSESEMQRGASYVFSIYGEGAGETIKTFSGQIPDQESKREFSEVREKSSSRTSPYFDPQKPFDSIVTFTGRCCALKPDDQHAFLSKVQHYFSRAAFFEERGDLEEFKERFTKVDFSFLVATILQPSIEEVHKLIADVQRATGLHFNFLGAESEILLTDNKYGEDNTPENVQKGWMQSELLNSQAASSSSDGKPGVHLLRSKIPLDPLLFGEEQLKNLDPEQVLGLFEYALDSGVKLWIDKVLDVIKGSFRWNTTIHLQLARMLDREEVWSLLLKKQISLAPSSKKLSEEQVLQLFKYNLECVGDYRSAVTLSAKGTEHGWSVLRKHNSEAGGKKRDFQEHVKLRIRQCSENEETRNFIEVLFDKAVERERWFSSDMTSHLYDYRVGLGGKQKIINDLNKNTVKGVFELSGFSEVRNLMLTSLVEKVSKEVTKNFCELHEIDKKVPKSVIHSLVAEACGGEPKRSFLLSDSEATDLTLLIGKHGAPFGRDVSLFTKKCFLEVLSNHTKSDLSLENVEKIKKLVSRVFTFEWRMSSLLTETIDLFLKYSFYLDDKYKSDSHETFAKKIVEKGIKIDDAITIAQFLSSEECTALFQGKLLGKIHTFLIDYMREVPNRAQLVEQFIGEVLTDELKQSTSVVEFLKRYLLLLCIPGGSRSYPSVSSLRKTHKVNEREIVELWALFEGDRFDDKFAFEWMPSKEAFLKGIAGSICFFDIELAVYKFIQAVSRSQWIEDDRIEKFIIKTISSLHSKITWIDDADYEKYLKNSLMEKIKKYDLADSDVTALKAFLSKEDVMPFFDAHEDLKKFRSYLLRHLQTAASAASSSSSSGSNGGECVIC